MTSHPYPQEGMYSLGKVSISQAYRDPHPQAPKIVVREGGGETRNPRSPKSAPWKVSVIKTASFQTPSRDPGGVRGVPPPPGGLLCFFGSSVKQNTHPREDTPRRVRNIKKGQRWYKYRGEMVV
jgi:hypothetical protein